MKSNEKKIVLVIASLFVITMLFPALNAQLVESSDDQESNMSNLVFTHTVLGEYCTSTTCGYCPGASDQMYQVYNMGYDFVFVSLVGNKNSYASGRMSELGFSAYPSVAFDGGYQKIVGLQPNYIPYQNAVQNCGSRTVADVNLDLQAFWMGSGEIQVTVDITNNGGSTYNGHLHVYVTEKTSRWDDASGDPYHFAMINNYAINQNVEVSSSSTQIYSDTWQGYSDISINNIRLIACVFDQSNMYTDETTSADPEYPNTNPPTTPSQPSGPSSGCVGIDYTFSTSSTEPNGDSIQYGWDWDNDGDVDEWTDLYPSGDTAETTHSWSSTGTYNFKVKAKDQFGHESSFSTLKQVQIGIGNPPNTPSAPDGEDNGMHGTAYSYSTSTTDPNPGDKLFYKFDWDDGSSSQWYGPYDSGEIISKDHSFHQPGTFNVKVKAKDLAGSESGWSNTATVIMGNTAPDKPSRPSGPFYGIVGIKYKFSSHTTDPEGDSIQYFFNWGDGTDSGWSSNSFAEHIWLESGEFGVRVKARDQWDESQWSSYITISIDEGSLIVNIEAEPTNAVVGEVIEFSATASGGTEPYTFNWDFGDENTSSEQNPTHFYENTGEYVVSLSVQDSIGAHGSNHITINIELTHPPEAPIIIDGLESALPRQPCDFTFSATDPNDDDVYFLVDWGDDSDSSWEGPYDSEDEIVLNHIWEQDGTYTVKAKAKDVYDYESEWSQTFEISVEWQQAFIIGKINNKEENEDTTELTAGFVIYLSSNPFKFKIYSSDEKIVVSNEDSGFIGNNFVFGRFKTGYIST